jgi:hypothetical protein
VGDASRRTTRRASQTVEVSAGGVHEEFRRRLQWSALGDHVIERDRAPGRQHHALAVTALAKAPRNAASEARTSAPLN